MREVVLVWGISVRAFEIDALSGSRIVEAGDEVDSDSSVLWILYQILV